MIRKGRIGAAIALACIAWTTMTQGAELAEQRVLAQNRHATVTVGDYRQELAAIPENMRFEFALVPKRVVGLIDGLLLRKTLAAEARRAGLEPEADAVAAGPAHVERSLASAYTKHLEREAGAAFDANRDQYAALVREVYLTDRKKYVVPEEISASHLFFSSERRGEANARMAAEQAATALAAGRSFDSLAAEVSDDDETKAKGGRLGTIEIGKHPGPLVDAVRALPRVGAVTAPVATAAGYHILRLDDRRPAREQSLDEARPAIMAALRAKYIDDQRDLRLLPLRRDPSTKVDEAAIEALISRRPAAKRGP